MKTILLVWVLVLALNLPHRFIMALFWFFVSFLALGLIAFALALIVGWIYAWRQFRRTHG